VRCFWPLLCIVTRARDNAHVSLEFRADGTVYATTARPGGQVVASTGRWTLNDKGLKFCLEFLDRASSGGCFGVVQDGRSLTLYTGKQKAPVVFGSVAN
jgi:hypothetical protein